MFLLNFDNFVIKAGFHRLWLIRLFVCLFDSVMSDMFQGLNENKYTAQIMKVVQKA